MRNALCGGLEEHSRQSILGSIAKALRWSVFRGVCRRGRRPGWLELSEAQCWRGQGRPGEVEGGFSNCLWRGAALSITDGLRLILLYQYLDVEATIALKVSNYFLSLCFLLWLCTGRGNYPPYPGG